MSLRPTPKDLPKLSKTSSAEQLLADADIAPGIVVVPASGVAGSSSPTSTPWSRRKPTSLCSTGLHETGGVPGRGQRPHVRASAAEHCDRRGPATRGGRCPEQRIWIIDDIYNTGNTAGSMASRLKEHLPALEEIVVVCRSSHCDWPEGLTAVTLSL